MATIPESVAAFLRGRRIGVAGVSRQSGQAANAVFRKLKGAGYEVLAINPHAQEVEARPRVAAVRADRGRRPPGLGHLNRRRPSAVASSRRTRREAQECGARGLACIVGGCPLMFCEPVDVAHQCMTWWFQRNGRVPK